MKFNISINTRRIEGPYGGGNRFVENLERHLIEQGHRVYRSLVSDLDVILIVAAQRELAITAYDMDALADYLALHPNTVVVHRVNTCDEQRGANGGINQAVLRANQLADHTVFVSAFMRDLYTRHGFDPVRPHSIVLTGADEALFHPEGRADWQPGEKLKLVTHHWSSNYLKGFDIYERIDQLLAREPFKGRFEFTFIGNVTPGVTFRHTRVLPPISGETLAQAIKQNHIHVTGARHEPGGNHYIEAMRCGLPVLYLESGSAPEYCASYGIGFNLTNFEEKLLAMRARYSELRETVLQCPHAAEPMNAAYEALFHKLVSERRANPRTRPKIPIIARHVMRRYYRQAWRGIGRIMKALYRRARP